MNLTSLLSGPGARWAHLVGHRLLDDLKPLAWAFGAVGAANLLTLLLFHQAVFQIEGRAFWTLFVVCAALISAANAFRALHDGRSSTDWILWPAGPGEKVAAAWAEALVLVPLVLTLGSMVLSGLLSVVELVVVGHSAGLWWPWTSTSAQELYAFFLALLVVSTGAAAFRRLVLLKTGLVVFGVMTVGVVVAMAWALGLGPLEVHRSGTSWQWDLSGLDLRAGRGHAPSALALEVIEGLAQLWYYGLLPAFCLAYTWFVVGEKEARDEVQ